MSLKPKVLVVDDEENIRFALKQILKGEGYDVLECANGLDAVEKIRQEAHAVVVMDIRMPRLDGLAALREMRQLRPEQIIVLVTAHGNGRTAVEAIEAGAYDYFTKPFDLNEVRVVIRRAVEKASLLRQIADLRQASATQFQFDRIVGQSGALQEVFQLIERVTDNDVTVLVTGESGTGKELVASAIHNRSPRRSGPFIRVNTVAIPETLLESEMFGHERGSFTGAVAQKIGKVEAADKGTLFLDEIGDMPMSLQAKLLRMLQERTIERVGSTKSIKVDIRIICATNRDLGKCVEQGTFREDLYYRINVIPIHLPPLRQRRDDIPILLDHFIRVYNPRLGKEVRGISNEALQRFLNYPWPGNIRELENVVQRTILMARGMTIQLDDLPPSLHTPALRTPLPIEQTTPEDKPIVQIPNLDMTSLLNTSDFTVPLAERLAQITDQVESHLIQAALQNAGHHRQETADLLGISRKSLHNKMVRYGLFESDRTPPPT